jgi:hypothetical protein
MEISSGTEQHDEYRESRGAERPGFWATVLGVAIGYVASKLMGL